MEKENVSEASLFLAIRKSLAESIWFSCHSNTPSNPHFLHDGISLTVIAAVAIIPEIKPQKSYLLLLKSFLLR